MNKNCRKTALIDITDLYHPYQDPGDNFDLIMAYALSEIDLKAVILDCTNKYRQPIAEHRIPEFADKNGPRDPGIIPVMQLNYLFGKNIPFGVSPFTPMRFPEDRMLDVPAFQQKGIELIIQILKTAPERVDIATYSSVRALAAAYNREPELFHEKVAGIHISAGASSPDFLEWNVELDQNAFVCLLRSNLPIAIYPCATKNGPFDLGQYNSFWELKDLSFIKQMDKNLKRYLWFAFERISRIDFLRAMDEDVSESMMRSIYQRSHNVWETAVWMELSQRKLVRRADGKYRIVPKEQIEKSDLVFRSELLPCKIEVRDNGLFEFELTDSVTNFKIYHRDNPKEHELALQEALPDIYTSFVLQR